MLRNELVNDTTSFPTLHLVTVCLFRANTNIMSEAIKQGKCMEDSEDDRIMSAELTENVECLPNESVCNVGENS